MTSNQVITKLWFESMDADHDLGNFTSFLRVCCGRYLALMAEGEISQNLADPLANIDSSGVLARENLRHVQKRHTRMESARVR